MNKSVNVSDDDDDNDNDTARTGGPRSLAQISPRGPDNFITFIAASIQQMKMELSARPPGWSLLAVNLIFVGHNVGG